jgi:hypothetical protein
MLIPVIALRPRVSNAFFRPAVQPVTLQRPLRLGFVLCGSDIGSVLRTRLYCGLAKFRFVGYSETDPLPMIPIARIDPVSECSQWASGGEFSAFEDVGRIHVQVGSQ